MRFNQILIKTVEKQGASSIKYIQPAPLTPAAGPRAEAFAQMRRDFGSVLPLVLVHSPVPDLFYSVWAIIRETLVMGAVPRGLKEAVSAAVSKINECPFCVDAHTIMLHAVAEHDVVKAILQGQSHQIRNPEVRALVEWASATRTPTSPLLLSPPFTPAEAPEIIGAAVAFHYINRMANIFLPETLLPIPPRLAGLKRLANRLSGSLLKALMAPTSLPGEALRFLPDAPLPPDFAWAAPAPHVAGAYARLAAAVETAGQAALPEEVRALVHHRLQAWQGEEPGLSRRWLEEAITGLDPVYHPAARFALLTALAAYQVDEGIINAFRAHHPGDDQLVGAAAWASFAAARRIGAWLQGAGAGYPITTLDLITERSHAHDVY